MVSRLRGYTLKRSVYLSCPDNTIKAKVFDWLVEKLEGGTLEMLFKADSTDENDLVSVSDFNGLVGELEAACSQSLSRKNQLTTSS